MTKVKLSVFRNDQLVDSYEFEAIDGVEQEIIIGRASDSHISLADHQVSRHHVSLTYSSGILSLKNLSQYQNVYVNGKNVNNALVSDTDSIQFYDYTLKIEGARGIQDFIPDDIDSLLNQAESIQRKVEESIPEETMIMSETEVKRNLNKEILEKENIETEIDNTGFGNDDGPLIKGNDDVKSITQRIQNILSSNDEDENDFEIDEGDFEEEIEQRQSEVLEFSDGFESNLGSGKELSEFSEDTGVIENFAQIYLSITGENVPYHKYILDSKETMVGSSRKSCDIVLEDDAVSEIHCRFIYDKKRVWVEDLGSNVGTYVNGEKINKIDLNQGDEILVGGISFILKVGSEVLSEEAKRLMPISSEQDVVEHLMVSSEDEADEFGFTGQTGATNASGGNLKQKFEAMMANPQKKRMFYYVLIIVAVFVLLDEGDDSSGKMTKTKKNAPVTETVAVATGQEKAKPKRSQEELEYLEAHYQLAKAKIDEGDYDGALFDAELVRTIDPNFNEIESVTNLAKQGLAALEEAERKKKEEQERLETERQIKELLAKSEEAMKEDKLILAQTYLDKIAEFDPENSNLYSLKLEIDAAKKEQERRQKEKEEQEKMRNEFMASLAPAKTFAAQGEWYKSIKLIEKVITKKGIDPELLDDANSVLKESQDKLKEETENLLTEARGYRQGEDLKNAYETYLKLLKINPISSEALNELDDIQANLDGRAKLVYREAIISESISLFSDAKEKYLEVLQIAPSESDYYKKAKAKLDEFYVE